MLGFDVRTRSGTVQPAFVSEFALVHQCKQEDTTLKDLIGSLGKWYSNSSYGLERYGMGTSSCIPQDVLLFCSIGSMCLHIIYAIGKKEHPQGYSSVSVHSMPLYTIQYYGIEIPYYHYSDTV